MTNKLFISLPMNVSDVEIMENFEKARKVSEILYLDITVIDSFIKEDASKNANPGVWYIGESIKRLSEADIICFTPDALNNRGCRFEFEVAISYGYKVNSATPSGYVFLSK